MKILRLTLTGILSLLSLATFAQDWQLVWQDEFNYSGAPDPSKWGYDVGAGGWGNGEAQYYTNNRRENARVENGNLIIEARRDWSGAEYSSARLVTRNKGDWKYGRVVVRAKIPLGQGMWPAIWMLPTDWEYGGWPASGEIDIMENFALGGVKPNEVEANIHTQAYHHSIGTNKGAKIHGLSNVEQNYHNYGVSWYEDRMVFDVDGREYFTFWNEGNWQAWPFDKRFHLILNIAVGGTLGSWIDPNIFPKRMTVDWVRVYQQGGTINTTGLITTFRDCDYKGQSSGLKAVGDYNLSKLEELGIRNDDISSLRITPGFKAILYQNDNFGGESTVINSDNACLNLTWNNKVSSIRVRPEGVRNLNGTYYLQNRRSGLFLDIAGGESATEDGANVHQWSFTGTKNQQFRLEHLNDGSYKVIAVHSNKALDVNGIKLHNDANIHQWTYFGSDNQKWIVIPSDNKYFRLVAQHSGRILEVFKCGTNNMDNVQQYDNNNQQCGQWRFIPVNAVTGTGSGLRAQYYNGNNFNNHQLTRVDKEVNMNWGNGSPDQSINSNDFSARWTGKIQAKYDGEHTFYLNADDGRKLWIDGELIINDWKVGSYESSGKKTLTAGQIVNMRIDYYEGGGDAKAEFSWATNLVPKEIIPESQLYPNELPQVSITDPVSDKTYNKDEAIPVSISASDDISINKVELYNGSQLVGTKTSAPYTFQLEGLNEGEHTLSARAYDSQEAVNYSEDVKISVSQLTSINDQSSAKSIIIYPNPVQSVLHIDTKVGTVIEVTDNTGKIVFTGEVGNQNTVNLSQLESGFYILKIVDQKNKQVIQSFVKE